MAYNASVCKDRSKDDFPIVLSIKSGRRAPIARYFDLPEPSSVGV